MARKRQRPDRGRLWDTYGSLPDDQESVLREVIYRTMHIGAIRSERNRMGRSIADLRDTYAQMAELLTVLR
ncbi:hypothetical protein BJY14_007849 [Actinomadura luteofluorescens]|uniref:Uncharacterized protein n=1 Tax=Actinomadura luteofluorescens TaxID=46163 RepID=A0A7Y9EQA7_9ACTN|nr:hypothetical protein [Actinomadura luteofluorescens]